MPHSDQLFEEAGRLADEGRYMESYLLYQQAAAAREELGEWSRSMVARANAITFHGKAGAPARQRYLMVMELRDRMHQRPTEIPNPPEVDFKSLVAQMHLNLISAFRPVLPDLLEVLDNCQPGHPSDCLANRCVVASMRGNHTEALRYVEESLASFDQVVNGRHPFSHKPSILSSAFDEAVEIGKLSLAEQFLRAAEDDLSENPCHNCERTILRDRVHMLLASGADPSKVLRAFTEVERQLPTVQRIRATDFLAARVALIDSEQGDPGIPEHPANRELRARHSSDEGIVHLWSRALMVADCRVAALRYAAGMEPVDDLHYARPQCVPERLELTDRHQFQSRLKKARTAANWASRYACIVDSMLECDWRQREVEKRGERIEEIARAAGMSSHDT